MYYENYRERIHHYTVTMTIMKKFYDDGLLTAAEFNYLEEKICLKYGLAKKSLFRIKIKILM